MRYAILIERGPRNFSAYVPDLPGCVATGDTLDEVKELMRQAIELHMAGLKEDGLVVDEPTSLCEYVEVELATN
ncbi:MAG: type II toxin-antitoxin system HicB family antitoxin [Candidatus Saccharimonas sp.]|nr:type II toxin-antitoxin system HicB family antitoxin [Planctomycetaceae bacterium]